MARLRSRILRLFDRPDTLQQIERTLGPERLAKTDAYKPISKVALEPITLCANNPKHYALGGTNVFSMPRAFHARRKRNLPARNPTTPPIAAAAQALGSQESRCSAISPSRKRKRDSIGYRTRRPVSLKVYSSTRVTTPSRSSALTISNVVRMSPLQIICHMDRIWSFPCNLKAMS